MKFHKIFKSIDDIEIKSIIFAVAGIALTFYCGINLITSNDELFGTITIFVMIFVIIGLVSLIFYLRKRHRERLAIESEIHELEEKSEENRQLYKEMFAWNHKYKSIVPAMVSAFKGTNQEIEKLRELAMETSNEFHIDNIKESVVELPEGWSVLREYLNQRAIECDLKDIFFDCVNFASDSTWDNLNFPKIGLIRLTSNLVSNAIKELDKIDIEAKQIFVRFKDSNGVFELEVFDNADEFPIHILSKLGERENSTNGTGYGYAEIFEFLNECKASLIITETSKNAKCIRVAFDGKYQKIIKSYYRYEKLKEALKDSNIKPIE